MIHGKKSIRESTLILSHQNFQNDILQIFMDLAGDAILSRAGYQSIPVNRSALALKKLDTPVVKNQQVEFSQLLYPLAESAALLPCNTPHACVVRLECCDHRLNPTAGRRSRRVTHLRADDIAHIC
jgi:hypothetical protein